MWEESSVSWEYSCVEEYFMKFHKGTFFNAPYYQLYSPENDLILIFFDTLGIVILVECFNSKQRNYRKQLFSLQITHDPSISILCLWGQEINLRCYCCKNKFSSVVQLIAHLLFPPLSLLLSMVRGCKAFSFYICFDFHQTY